jgi:hypothetical protein
MAACQFPASIRFRRTGRMAPFAAWLPWPRQARLAGAGGDHGGGVLGRRAKAAKRLAGGFLAEQARGLLMVA